MSEETKSIVTRIVDQIYNQGSLEAWDDLIHEEYSGHGTSITDSWHIDGRIAIESLREAFPDLRVTVDEMISEGDKVALRATLTGTHLGEFRGIRPIGARATWKVIGVMQVADGKAVESWTHTDSLGILQYADPKEFLQQLGALPSLESIC